MPRLAQSKPPLHVTHRFDFKPRRALRPRPAGADLIEEKIRLGRINRFYQVNALGKKLGVSPEQRADLMETLRRKLTRERNTSLGRARFIADLELPS